MSRSESATAAELLREIATELVRIPVNERTRRLHLKALALKQEITGWSIAPPASDVVDAMHEALRALRIEVLDVRSNSEVRLRSTYRPANDDIPPAFLRRAKG